VVGGGALSAASLSAIMAIGKSSFCLCFSVALFQDRAVLYEFFPENRKVCRELRLLARRFVFSIKI
jgi:hypothetical protein